MRQSNYCLLFTKNTSWYGAVIRQSRSKTACRGFKSFCPCQTDSLKNGLFKPFLRLFFLFRAVLMLGEWVKNPRFGVYLVFMGIGLYRELLRFAAGFWLIHLVPSACFFDFAAVDF